MSAKPSPLAHHFATLRQQHEANTLGMWLFLSTELMLFGGLFTGYIAYRYLYPEAWAEASRALNIWFGGGNTLVLLTSSLTMALGVYYAQVGNRRALVNCLLLTALLGAAFMVSKGFEYYHDYEDALVPGLRFRWPPPKHGEARPPEAEAPGETTAPIPVGVFMEGSPRARQVPDPRRVDDEPARRAILFFMFYYVMTGLHAVHLTVGIVMLLILAWLAHRGRYTPEFYSPVEVGGLYWHLVDVIWIFLLPMLYLVG